jgi:hypothetical protein
MSKVFTIAASLLKAIPVAATSALARGDMLPVILISVLLDLALQLGARPVTQTAGRRMQDACE